MDKLLNRLRILFLVLFVLGAGASWTYHILWAMPRKECLMRGNWWSDRKRVCAVPVDITEITGRKPGAPVAAPAAPAQP